MGSEKRLAIRKLRTIRRVLSSKRLTADHTHARKARQDILLNDTHLSKQQNELWIIWWIIHFFRRLGPHRAPISCWDQRCSTWYYCFWVVLKKSSVLSVGFLELTMTMTKTMTRVPPWARSPIRVPTVVPFTSEAFCEPVVVGGRRRPGLKIFITSPINNQNPKPLETFQPGMLCRILCGWHIHCILHPSDPKSCCNTLLSLHRQELERQVSVILNKPDFVTWI